ncbi:hypothetical protein OQY15_03735 [Pedobacter sp. MC2016-15]|uniref:hypothetical protein n=1 Tax=Pedobacter sp. MC2016-15 TaxID=2994473 RepID=UPI0022471CAC|nr:hypothetical protein [Pedobacter sp. MC2016-15]MCX2478185.1 hypothetical protein [Pedobacter sp. MC2016-15]
MLQRNITSQYIGRVLDTSEQGTPKAQQLIKDPYIFEFLCLPIDTTLFESNNGLCGFKLIPDPSLLTNLSGYCGALLIRAILQKLSIDEHQVLKFRLENKFKQYQIFNHFAPGCMPDTLPFSKLLA